MIVTSITRQKRHLNRANLFLDGEFAFGIHPEVLTQFRIRKGDTIDQAMVEAIMAEEEYSRAKQKALRLVSYRRRSQKELRQRLLEKEFRPLVVDRVMAHLQSLGFVNDEEFARALVHDAQIKKASGRKLLHHRLREKGISPSIIRDVLTETLSEETEQNAALDAAKKLVERYGNSRKKIDQDKQRKRLAQALARRGFAWSIISPVLQTLFYNEPSSERET